MDVTAPARLPGLEDAQALCRDRPAIVLETVRRHCDANPADPVARQVFDGLLNAVFAASRQAFAEGRLLDCAQLFAVLADHGEPRAPLRADLDVGLQNLTAHAMAALQGGDATTARRTCRQALAIDPGFAETLRVLAFLERGNGTPADGLRITLWALRADPAERRAALHRDLACQRAAEALTACLYDPQRRGEAAALLALLQRADDDFAAQAQRLRRAGGGPCDLERMLRLRLGRQAQQDRDYDGALRHFLRASELRVGAVSLQGEALARQYLMLEQLRGCLRSQCSAYVNDQAGHADSREVFRDLDALMVQALEARNIDHWTRTQFWGGLMSWRAMIDYAAALGRNPYDPPQTGPFQPPAAAKNGERRLFDCCTFFNEAEILEIRLRELYDVVDGFVVAEATHTHAGQPKPLVFNDHRDRFRPWLDKIAYVVDDGKIDGFSWRREAQQRDSLLRGLTGCRDDDMIVVSDVDEILRRDVAAGLRRVDPDDDAVVTLEMDLFFYRLNYRFRRDWRSAGAAPYRIVRQTGTNAVRYLALQEIGPRAAAAGWHFSWIGDVDRFVAKMTAYAHQEHAAQYAADSRDHQAEVRRFLAEGGPPPGCGPGHEMGEYAVLPVDGDFPLLVREEQARFAAMGWIGAAPVGS